MGVKYKQPALMTILMQVDVLLHVPRLNLHASDHFVTSLRPQQVRACCFFFTKQNLVYSGLGTSLHRVFTLPFPLLSRTVRRFRSAVVRKQHSPPKLPSRNQSTSELQLFLIRRCILVAWSHGLGSCWPCQTQSNICST